MRRYLLVMAAITLLVLPTVWGCGGGMNSTVVPRGGAASVTIAWPAPSQSRLIPTAAQSITLTMNDGGGFTASQTVARPSSGNTSTVNFTNLPVGLLNVTATAYPQANGTGTAQATGATQVTTLAGQSVGINLTMASTIDHIDITSSGLSVAVNSTLQLTATPKDVANSIVLTAAGNITWSSASPGVATVSASGLVTGVSAGTSVITARETDSNKSQTATVTVTSAPGFTLTLTLDASLSRPGTIKATSITGAELLNGAGSVVKTATISGSSAVFDMTGLTTATEYFIRVNGLADDLVPTRMDSVSANLTQYVSQQLNHTAIGGTLASPVYRILTYSKGQGQHAVVNFSNGATSLPERYAYVLFALASGTKRTEIRVLGSGALLSTINHKNHSFPGWIMTTHNAAPDDAACDCHSPIAGKAASYGSINASNGWCYRCHYGDVGISAGPVDPTK